MGIQKFIPVKRITRVASLVAMGVIGLSVYQFVYLPNQSLIQLNREKANELLTSLDEKNEIHSKYQHVRGKLNSVLHQKQNKDKQQSRLQTCDQLVSHVGLSLKTHGAFVEVCQEFTHNGKQNDPGTKHVKTVFSCDFPQLFLKHLQGITVSFLLVFSLLSIYKIAGGYTERHRL